MHETSLVSQLLRQVEQAAREAGARKVTVVRLRVGAFAGVELALLASAFEMLSAHTIAAGARLDVTPVALEARCDACDASFRVENFRFVCPGCGSGRTEIIAGEELVLESLSVEPIEEPYVETVP